MKIGVDRGIGWNSSLSAIRLKNDSSTRAINHASVGGAGTCLGLRMDKSWRGGCPFEKAKILRMMGGKVVGEGWIEAAVSVFWSLREWPTYMDRLEGLVNKPVVDHNRVEYPYGERLPLYAYLYFCLIYLE
ncbi:hypothetical protein AVEN_155307-1 [Araneus ventricosus]|uniref:Uncharacterized protein n=1 Tax=Araneus ventricosus TaxID=182803 RepID=A0A4Y2D7T6_ARAVE|nr:hypothetical protein AVEN_155307-1 [Araneus ventricosus]